MKLAIFTSYLHCMLQFFYIISLRAGFETALLVKYVSVKVIVPVYELKLLFI